MSPIPDNIVLLSADALRADHLSCYGYEREISPHIDSLYNGSIAFSNAFSASSHTREAIPSLLTGEYPDSASDKSHQLTASTIASILSEMEYRTGAFHSNPYASRAFGFGREFDKFFDDLYFGKNRFFALAQRAFDLLLNRHYARAEKINKLSLSWVDSLDSDEPFFLWNHYMDTHGPYEPPAEFDHFRSGGSGNDAHPKNLYKTAVNDSDSISAAEHTHLLDSYDGEIRYLDHHIGEFLDALEQRDLLDDSLVIFTSDHGDAFGEHDYYGHPRMLHDELLHVPLIIRCPGDDQTVYSSVVSTLDIVPTITEIIGEDDNNDINNKPGKNLRTLALNDQDTSSRAVFSIARGERSESNIWRFSIRTDESTAFAEYDFDQDTLKTRGDSSCKKELRAFVFERISRPNQDKFDGDEVDNAAVEDRLSALGYK